MSVDCDLDKLDELVAERDTLQAKLAAYEEVLEFYGDEENWIYKDIGGLGGMPNITKQADDGGDRARAFLSKHKASEGK